MGMFDVVEEVLEPYDQQFKLWDCDGSYYKTGDWVPKVGMADTYAIHLNGPSAEPRYLWVQGGKITNVMAHQPIAGKAVFDKWGRCLGQGGGELETPGPNPITGAMGLMELADPSRQNEATPSQTDATRPAPKKLTHRFYLHPDVEVHLSLPIGFSRKDAERLCRFISTLPFDGAG